MLDNFLKTVIPYPPFSGWKWPAEKASVQPPDAFLFVRDAADHLIDEAR